MTSASPIHRNISPLLGFLAMCVALSTSTGQARAQDTVALLVPPVLSSDLQAIADATELSFGSLGRSPDVSDAFAAYSRLAWMPAESRQLEWVAAHGSPSGRIYAALLLWHQDEAAGRRALEGMLGAPDSVTEIVGCIVDDHTLGALAADYLVTGPLPRPVIIDR